MSAALIDKLWALGDQHSPQRVLVVVREQVTARWLAGLLAERGVVVGLRLLSLEGLLSAAMEELRGEELSPTQVLAEVREALLSDPGQRFAAIVEQPSYQRAVARRFVELERSAGSAGEPEATVAALELEPSSRDGALVEAYLRFRGRVAALAGSASSSCWWRGEAPRCVVAGRKQVSFLRRRAAAVALGFAPETTALWETEMLEVLGFERWSVELGGRARGSSTKTPDTLALRLSCAGPEAEIAAVSRLLRARSGQGAAVLCPSEAVPRWVARLRHRDLPVRAWVERRAAHTGAARSVRGLLELAAEPTAARRSVLEGVLFGTALRPWAEVAEALDIDYPSCPHPGDLQAAWQEQRAASVSLTRLAERLQEAAEVSAEALGERGRRHGWAAEELEARQQRARDARLMLAEALSRLSQLALVGAAGLHELLEDWDLLGRAAVHGVAGPEMSAARLAAQLSARASEHEVSLGAGSFARFARDFDHALAGSAAGSWEQSRAEGSARESVWIVPYTSAAVLGGLSAGADLPPRLFLTGLDAHPRPPSPHALLSDPLRSSLGLVRDRRRFNLELRMLDELAAHRPGGQVIASWRHRDAGGSRRPPGPWIAGRQDQGAQLGVGVDAIALDLAHEQGQGQGGGEPAFSELALAPCEARLLRWHEQPGLRRRVEAIQTHDAAAVGPHTGELGVDHHPGRPYSASALQRYARQPYAYFVERVVGLRERGPRADSSAALLASEQGQIVHRALEEALGRRLREQDSVPLNLGQTSAELFVETIEALVGGYAKRAAHAQSEAIWTSERDRWSMELRAWWARWDQRMRAGWDAGAADASRSGSRMRPEHPILVPAPLLLAAEWSPGGEVGFELDLLGLRKIPFVAAIDRIELDPRRRRVVVVDYKTGRPRAPGQLNLELRAGAHLQLPLYAHAVNQVVAADPGALRMPAPVPVGAMRLEYLQRPPARGGKLPTNEARGFAPNQPLGVDSFGNVWTIERAAASFALAFVNAIEGGHFPLVARLPLRGRQRGSDRFAELARTIPSAAGRPSARLPPSLAPLPDPREAREVVQ